MKKNININIGGIIFHIEEDGFDKLKNYLDSVNSYFSSFDESKEIIEDIEGRIAEIFLAKLDDGKQVITQEDVEGLIATMGTVKDFEETIETEAEPKDTDKDEPGDHAFSGKGEENQSSQQPKRLYRDAKRKIIGGVASGLAHYFSIDPIWVRLIMIVPLLSIFFFSFISGGWSGFTIISYIILWIAVPVSDELEEDNEIKKLFRNDDEKVLGGVASGIASYFGVDPVVMRVIFIAAIPLVGSGLIAYIILWIITPEAKSITEKMQMQGEPVTLSGIEENVKKKFNTEGGEESVFVKILLFPFRLIALLVNALGKFLKPILKFSGDALRVLAGIFLIFLGASLVLAFTISLIVVLGVGGSLEHWVHLGDFPPAQLFNTLGVFTVIFGYLASVIPPLLLLLSGVSIITKKWVTKSYIGWSLFGLWLIGVVGMAINLPTIIGSYTTDSSHHEEKSFLVENATPTLRLNELDFDSYQNVNLKIRGHEDSAMYKLELDFSARGSSKSDARKNAEAVDYKMIKKQGDFYFDSDLSFNNAPFRFQEVEATFFIPYGKVFKMDRDLEDILINSLWMYDYHASDMEDNNWMFEEDGSLKCITCEKEGSSSSSGTQKSFSTSDSQSFQFEDFNEVNLNSLFDFEIEKSDTYSVRLVGDEDDLDEVYLTQIDEELEIRYRDDWKWWKNPKKTHRIKVVITMPELTHLEVAGACEGKVSNFDNSDMSFGIVGASKVFADIDVDYVEIDLTGASTITLEGRAKELEADIVGASKLDAFDFKVEDAYISAVGASNGKVYATDELNINAAGASTVRYKGSAEVSSSSTGMSSVKKY